MLHSTRSLSAKSLKRLYIKREVLSCILQGESFRDEGFIRSFQSERIVECYTNAQVSGFTENLRANKVFDLDK